MERYCEDEPQAVERAAAFLSQGGVVLYPTDTLYGLGADARNDAAVARVYDLKGRPAGKPVHVIVADMAMAAVYVEVTPLAVRLAAEFLPGPLTLVLKSRGAVSPLLEHDGTLGVRMPDRAFCLTLARAFGAPFTTTSANRSGAENARDVTGALAVLGGTEALIDCVVDGGPVSESLPSTIVDARGEHPVLIRSGVINFDALSKV